jgi:hypothetical protein
MELLVEVSGQLVGGGGAIKYGLLAMFNSAADALICLSDGSVGTVCIP